MKFFILAEYLKTPLGTIHLPSLAPWVALAGILIFILTILPMLIYIDRIVLALIQDRSGPNRVGPRGLLQTTADVIKLFFKEDSRPLKSDAFMYTLAPMIGVVTAFSAGAVLAVQFQTFYRGGTFSVPEFAYTPGVGETFTVPLMPGNVNIGFLFILAMSSLQVYGMVLAGWASNNKYSLLGGLRASAQMISYELAMGLSLICAVVLAGSLQLDKIIEAQSGPPFPGAPEFLHGSILSWFCVKTLGVPVLVYTIAMIAECNRAPFDLPEAESELIAGFMTEYSSMKFAMFFTAEYVAMLVVSALGASVFWGGPLPPINFEALANIPGVGLLFLPLAIIPGHIWFILKVMLGIFLFAWIRGTLPRLRYDQLMNLGWKKLLPLTLIWLFLLAGLDLAVTAALPKPAQAVPAVATEVAPETISESLRRHSPPALAPVQPAVPMQGGPPSGMAPANPAASPEDTAPARPRGGLPMPGP